MGQQYNNPYMALPFFYIPAYDPARRQLILDEDTSRHVVQVLRMQPGEQLHLTDGKGHLLRCEVAEAHKKHCLVNIISSTKHPEPAKKVTIAISLVKNTSRFEWFLEKATEIGVTDIIPLLCERTEKEKFRHDRLQGICISAMLQSQQVWLPVLHEPAGFDTVAAGASAGLKLIAHCMETERQPLTRFTESSQQDSLILIGPEGDFTSREVDLALSGGFQPVSLGNTRLRTETAGVVAAALLCLV